MKRVMGIGLLILLLVASTACSSGPKEEATYDVNEVGTEMAQEKAEGPGDDGTAYSGLQTNRKVIQRARVIMETLTFDETVTAVKEKVYEEGGYFETMRVDGERMDRGERMQSRDAYFVIRVPANRLEYFLTTFKKVGNVIVNELNSDDVTDQYVDTESRLNALRVQEERLLTIMKEATEIEDIIALEQRLSDVRYEIEKYTGSLRKWDNLVDMATIELDLSEVREISEPEPETLWSRSVEGFIESTEGVLDLLQNLVVFCVALVPYLVVFVPIGLFVRWAYKKFSGSRLSNSLHGHTPKDDRHKK